MTDIERAVQLTARELGVIQGLAATNRAETVTIREQSISQSDGRYGFADRSRSRRAYVVTIVKRAEAADTPPFGFASLADVQLLLVSGPDIDGPVDVVALSPLQSEQEVPA